MKHVPTILSIQDMSSVGRCSLTVFIPLVSALRCQPIPLPTAVLCNHLEYPNFELVDITDHLESFYNCWNKNDITFDAIQSGFLASPEQIRLVEDAIERFGKDKLVVVDPAMADDGKLYSIYNDEMVKEMRKLITKAYMIKPNYTEACFLLDIPYDPTPQSEEVIYDMCRRLHAQGPEYVVLSSLPSEDSALIAVYRGSTDTITWVSNPLVQVKAHGTGDTFTAILTALVLRGYTPEEASRIAGHFRKVPLPTGAMVHLGSAALFSIASVVGGFYAGLAGAIGSGIFDLITGHFQYTVFSIVIKGLTGVIIGLLTVGWRPSVPARSVSTPRILLAMLVGAIWTAAGYFVAWWVVLNSYAVAANNLPASFLTSGIGILVALLLIPILRRIPRK